MKYTQEQVREALMRLSMCARKEYQFYDEAGNYVGDSENDNLEEIIQNAYIKII